MTTKNITLKSDINILSKIAKFLKLFASDKDLFITVSDDKAKIRSNAQNALIHVYYTAISEKTGYEVDDCEARCKRRFGLPIMQVQKGESTKNDWAKNISDSTRVGIITYCKRYIIIGVLRAQAVIDSEAGFKALEKPIGAAYRLSKGASI